MDQNSESTSKTYPNDSFLDELVSLNGCSLLAVSNRDHSDHSCDQTNRLLSRMSSQSLDKHMYDSSLQLLDDNRMDTCLTPSVQMKTNVSQRNGLFALHNNKQLFANNFCVESSEVSQKGCSKSSQICDSKENMDIDFNYMDNSLGLSPVKILRLKPSQALDKSFSLPSLDITSRSSDVLKDIETNNFSAKEQQFGTNSLIIDQSFRSVSKCSDFELRDEPKLDINDTYRSPNSNFENKSIDSYFRQQSEAINSFKSSNDSIVASKGKIASKVTSKNTFNLNDESFASVCNEIDLADKTLEIAHKLINRKNRKRKSSICSTFSSSSDQALSFAPSVNSTLNSSQDTTEKVLITKEDNSSGFGTISAFTQQTFAIPNSRSVTNYQPFNGNSLNLNQLLFISPNVLCLSIGCFVGFKLNYLKIKNLSVTAFSTEIKVKANVDTLNSLDIDYPKQVINIPPFFDGILSDRICITPLKSGSFQLEFQVYPRIENLNLPISPISVICNIKVEELVIKRPFYSSIDCSLIDYNLFEDNRDRQTINLLIPNKKITNEIPLRLNLKANSGFTFEPIYRHPDSAIHSFRCSDANTLFLTTKTQYEMRIPIRVEANGQCQKQSSLTVSIDSTKSHVLSIIQLRATFWPKKQLTEPSLQCSESSIKLTYNKWKAIHFRNKSEHNLISVRIKCVRDKASAEHLIKLSTNKLMIRPLEKACIGLLVDQKALIDTNSPHLLVSYDSGIGKRFTIEIPIEIH